MFMFNNRLLCEYTIKQTNKQTSIISIHMSYKWQIIIQQHCILVASILSHHLANILDALKEHESKID